MILTNKDIPKIVKYLNSLSPKQVKQMNDNAERKANRDVFGK